MGKDKYRVSYEQLETALDRSAERMDCIDRTCTVQIEGYGIPIYGSPSKECKDDQLEDCIRFIVARGGIRADVGIEHDGSKWHSANGLDYYVLAYEDRIDLPDDL